MSSKNNPHDFVIFGAKNPEMYRLYLAVKKDYPGLNLLGFVDDNPSLHGEWFGLPVKPVVAVTSEWKGVPVFNGVTSSARVRYTVHKRIKSLGNSLQSLIHPSVDLSMVTCGRGLYLQERVVVQAMCELGDGVSIHIGSLIGHESSVGDASFIAHGCVISGRVHIGRAVFLGAGAVVHPDITIGDGAVIGCGAAIIRDVEPNAVVVGVPGEVKKHLEPLN